MTLRYSNTACTGPWSSYGTTAAITQASNPAVAFALDVYSTPASFVNILITGNAVVTYVGQSQLPLSTSVGALTFPITVPQGGTGASSFTLNGVLFGNTTSALGVTAAGSQYQVLQAGASGVPAFGAVNLAQSAAVTGQLPVPKGGTGAPTLTLNGVLFGNTTSAVGMSAAGTQYQVLQANGSGVPVFGAVNLASSSAVTGLLQPANGGFGSASTATPLTYFRVKPNVLTTAIETAILGASLQTTDYFFPSQAPGGSLIAGGINQAVSLAPCPIGVAGADTAHYVYLSGGTGTAEAVLITGGTCTSGAASGAVTLTPANNHSGAWTVSSATGGIQESVCALGSAGGTVHIPAGSYALYASVSFCGKTKVNIEQMNGVLFTSVGVLPTSALASTNLVTGPEFRGVVRLVHSPNSDTWVTYKPDGTILDTSASTCSGFDTALDYALVYGWTLRVSGGWVGSPTDHANLYCVDTTITVGPLALVDVRFEGVFVNFQSMGAKPGILFESWDIFNWDMGNSQITYDGTTAAVWFKPTTAILHGVTIDDGFIGGTSSHFRIAEIACYGASTAGVRFDMPFNAGVGGDGLIVNNVFDLGEIVGCLNGILVNNPQSTNVFTKNTIYAQSVHGNVTAGVQIGTSTGANDKIFGNRWYLTVNESVPMLDTFGGHSANGGDSYYLEGGGTVTLESGAAGNSIFTSASAAIMPVTDSSGAANRSNRLYRSGAPTRTTSISLTSTVAYQPSKLQPCMVNLQGGTVSAITWSSDNATFEPTGLTAGLFTLPPGGSIKPTYTVVPTTKTAVCW